MVRELTCIGCPLGCPLKVTIEGDVVTCVTGNTCPRGEKYARKECTSPERTLTSSVRVIGGNLEVVPVKTKGEIPKELIFLCMKALKDIKVQAPVKEGDIIIENFHNTGISVVATRDVEKK